MPNITISGLPPATLPLDGPNSFFEVQTIEGGETVSRKIAADDINLSSAIVIEDEGVPLAGGADTLDFIGAGVTASGAGSTKTIEILGGGQVDSVVSGVNITIDATDPINPIANLDAAITGVSVNGVTLSDAGLATDFLNEAGGYSTPAGGGQVDSVVGGTNISVNVADPVNPIVNLDAAITGVSVNAVTLSAAGAATNYLDESGGYSIPAGAGGGVDSVTAGTNLNDSGTAADPILNVDDPLIIGSVNATSSEAVNQTVTPYANVALNIGPNLVGTQGIMQINRQNIQTRQSAFGYNSTLFININGAGTAGSNTIIGGLNGAQVEVDFGVAVRFQHAQVGTTVAETAAAASGGFLVNNLATGAGLERVLTTADLGGGAVTELEDSGGNVRVIAQTFGVMQLKSVANTTTENRRLDLTLQNGDVQADFGFNASNILEIRQRIHGANVYIGAENAGGAFRRAIEIDPDSSGGGTFGRVVFWDDAASISLVEVGQYGDFATDTMCSLLFRDAEGVQRAAGPMVSNPSVINANRTINEGDFMARTLHHDEVTERDWTLNQLTTLAPGVMMGIVNFGTGGVLLISGAGVAFEYWDGSAYVNTTGNITLPTGRFSVWKVTDILYEITGPGIT